MRKYLFVLMLAFAELAFADAYVDTGKPFLEIKDVNRQAETWAVCAASYDIMSTIMQEGAPARAQQLSDLGNGAKLSAGMTLVTRDLDPDISLEKFKLLWADAQVAMTEWPQEKLYAMLADAERMGDEGAEAFGRKINATVVACINNLEAQRMYIASWQELIKSGLLQPSVE